MGTRALDDLSSPFRLRVNAVLARLMEHNTPVMIVQTLRTLEGHQQNLINGTSSVALSKHLPRILRGYPVEPDKCDAIDLCPYSSWEAHGPDKLSWDDTDPIFALIGQFGEAEGLRWGGRWAHPHDPGHLELVLPAPPSHPTPKEQSL